MKNTEESNKIYTLKVSVNEHPFADVEKNTFRTFEVESETSLYDLAYIITQAFDFDFDHAFGFYDNPNTYRSKEIYELFTDIPDCESTEGVQGVYKPTVEQVFIKGKKMTFLFDYGDEWHFLVECKDIAEKSESPAKSIKYPRITLTNGKAPEQYPSCE